MNDQPKPRAVTMHDVLAELYADVEHRMKHGGATGVPTGFCDYDNLTGGLHASELAILAAHPAMGKTALATNIVDHVAVEAGVRTLVVSLAVTRIELIQRMICARGKIDGRKFRGGFLSGEDREGLVKASAELSKAPIYVVDSPGLTVAGIAEVARSVEPSVIVVDYLSLLDSPKSVISRYEHMADCVRELKRLARELNCAVLCVAQLRRSLERTRDNRPRLYDLRDSGTIEEDADVVMLLHREEYFMTYEEARDRGLAGKAELIVAKHRSGPTDDVRLTWRPEFLRFENRALDYDEFSSDEF